MKQYFNKNKNIIHNTYKIIIIVIAAVLIINYLFINSSLFYRKGITLPFSLHLNKQDIILVKGEEFRLFVYGINKRTSYSSTNFRVAGVNFNGRVFAYRVGKAFILVKVDKKVLKCRVRVIDINNDKLNLREGDTYRLKIKGMITMPRWRSSNPKVATVSLFGKVKAKTPGSTIITAKIKGKVVKCRINVIQEE